MRKPVISSEISPKFAGVLTTDILPIAQLIENIVYQTHITRFSAVSKPEKQISVIEVHLRLVGDTWIFENAHLLQIYTLY